MATVTGFQFGIGTGAQTAFIVIDPSGDAAANPVVSSLYLNDWQGNRLLYTTARTNLLTHSGVLTNAAWTLSAGATVNATPITGPDGLASGYVFTGGSTDSNIQHLAVPRTSGTTYTDSIWAKVPSGALATKLITASSDGAFTASDVTITTSWQRFQVARAATSTGAGASRIQVGGFSTIGVGVVIHLSKGQVEASAAATPYHSSGATADVVTDYAIAGSTATLAPAPDQSGLLSWTGTDANGPFIPKQAWEGLSARFGHKWGW